MSDPQENRQPDEAVVPAPAAMAHLASASLGRRRLIKLGASVVPTALTLSSRPVHAWSCNSTSAWGSAQINPSQSVTARETSASLKDNTWTITQWATNTAGTGSLGKPWPQLSSKLTSKKQISAYLVSDLYSGVAGIPAGLNAKDSVYDKLSNGTTFQKYLLTARLNARVVANVQSCLTSGTSDQLALMASGSYSPPNLPSVVWDQNQIIKYLNANYIVLP